MDGTFDLAALTAELTAIASEAGRQHSVAVVLPLRAGMKDVAADFLAEGPPFDPGQLKLADHRVFLTDQEIIFVFETKAGVATLSEMVAEPDFWTMVSAWEHLMAGQPRVGSAAYRWVADHAETDHAD